MRRFLLIAAVVFGVAAAPSDARVIVPYLWGGLLQDGVGVDRFHRSAAFLLNHGFTAIRIAATPNAVASYGLDPSQCPGGAESVSCILNAELASPVFDDPRLRALYITFQETTDDSHAETDAALLTRDAPRLRAEYDAALDSLARRFQTHHIPITLLNWEGDNKIYCGSLYAFTQKPDSRAACLREGAPQARIAAFLAWMQFRQQVVQAARQRHPDLDIQVAPEINGINAMQHCKPAGACDGYPTLLNALGQSAPLPLCSYSAYSSLNAYSLAQDLPRLLAVCHQVILGEVGYRYTGDNGDEMRRDYDYLATAIAPFQKSIPAVIAWNAFEADAPHPAGHGLYTSSGTPLEIQFLPAALVPRQK
jgi:hypothetical protein